MTTAGNDTGTTREDEGLAGAYQQVIGARAEQYAAAYDVEAGLARLTRWLADHAPTELESDLDADRAAAQLYATHSRSLVRLAALLVRDSATAEEVVQDAFVAMRSAWPRLRNAEDRLAYLRQAVVNRARSVLRHRTVVDRNMTEAPQDVPGADHGVFDLLARPGTAAALRGARAAARGDRTPLLRRPLRGADSRGHGYQPRGGQEPHRSGDDCASCRSRRTGLSGPGQARIRQATS